MVRKAPSYPLHRPSGRTVVTIGRTKAVETEDIKPVETKIVEATLAKCSPVVAAMIRLQLLTGALPGEICNLTPSMVNRSGKVWQASLIEHKSAWRGKERTIFIGNQRKKAPWH